MRVLGLLALGGAMGLKFEDLSYTKLKSAFSKVSFMNPKCIDYAA